MPIKIDHESTEPDVRIEIIPLIDVIFCLLTFFILAAVTLTRQTAINVDLPKAGTGTSQMRQILVVSVDPIGQAYVEKQPVSRDQLYQALLGFRQAKPDGLLVLYASRAASYNDVVQVLDMLRSVGGDRVALATLPGTSNDNQPQLPNVTPGLGGQGSQGNSFDPLQPPSTSTDPLGLNRLPGSNPPLNQPNNQLDNKGVGNSPSLKPSGVGSSKPSSKP
jgi:biopolymer transport protein ExbD